MAEVGVSYVVRRVRCEEPQILGERSPAGPSWAQLQDSTCPCRGARTCASPHLEQGGLRLMQATPASSR